MKFVDYIVSIYRTTLIFTGGKVKLKRLYSSSRSVEEIWKRVSQNKKEH